MFFFKLIYYQYGHLRNRIIFLVAICTWPNLMWLVVDISVSTSAKLAIVICVPTHLRLLHYTSLMIYFSKNWSIETRRCFVYCCKFEMLSWNQAYSSYLCQLVWLKSAAKCIFQICNHTKSAVEIQAHHK